MSVRDIIEQLRAMGYEVRFFVRKDGGVRITRIDEQRFTGSQGNTAGRNILGVQLSERRRAQLQKISTPKGSFGHNKLQKLPKDLERELRKAQRLFRKQGVKQGAPRTKQVRYLIKTYGEQEARRKLTQSMRYAQGLAYEENVEHLIERLEMDKVGADSHEISVIDKIIQDLERRKAIFKESWLSQILGPYGALYQWEENRLGITIDDVYSDYVIVTSA